MIPRKKKDGANHGDAAELAIEQSLNVVEEEDDGW